MKSNKFLKMNTNLFNNINIKKIHNSLTDSKQEEECLLNYERYRTLVQNEAVGSNYLASKYNLMDNDSKNIIQLFFSP